jgi:serine/threonine-protein kinase HipA
MSRCLYCYQLLAAGDTDYHKTCSKKFFGQALPPDLPYTEGDMEELAMKVIKSHAAVTGVQPKLSLELTSEKKNAPKRFTIVGLWGGYILKPPPPHYPQLPEVEDLTMHLAVAAKISVVPHSLIRLQSGNLAYITKRIDRGPKGKRHMEDMCQLTERQTEYKYQGSYDQIAKAIKKYSSQPGLDLVNFAELLLFCYLTGNADMHLKNFSLIHQPTIGAALSPAYDLVATTLVNPADQEETAQTLNGKKRKLKAADFAATFTAMGLDERQQKNVSNKMTATHPKWIALIDNSFVSEELKSTFKDLVAAR